MAGQRFSGQGMQPCSGTVDEWIADHECQADGRTGVQDGIDGGCPTRWLPALRAELAEANAEVACATETH